MLVDREDVEMFIQKHKFVNETSGV
jgi:hypothetical protein